MRKIHIDYLKTLVTGIAIGGNAIFPAEKFFEIDPPLDRFQERVPFCVIKYVANQPVPNGRRIQRLSDKIISGVRNLRFLKQHFKTEYRYSLNFWLEDPEKDIISQPGGSSGENILQSSDLGIFDQVLLYLATHDKILSEQGFTIEVLPGRCAVVPDPALEMGVYKIYCEVIFADGFNEIETVPSLSDATIETDGEITVQSL